MVLGISLSEAIGLGVENANPAEVDMTAEASDRHFEILIRLTTRNLEEHTAEHRTPLET